MLYKWFAIFLAVMVWTPLCFAESHSCSFEALTQNCSMFSPDGPYKIKYPDGTYLPNFSALSEAAAKSKMAEFEKQKRDLNKKLKLEQDDEFDVADMLDTIPSSKLSPRLKLMLANEPTFLGNLFDPAARMPKHDLQLPWPPDNARARVQKVTLAQARTALAPLFSAQQKQDLVTLKNNYPNLNYDTAVADAMRVKTPLTDEMSRISPPRLIRMKQIVEYARAHLISHIVGNKPESEWSPAERAAVEKINAIQYHPGTRPDVKNAGPCLGLLPNAFYNSADNSINVCPSFYNFPDSTLMLVIAHEMGHSADPCEAQFPLYQITLHSTYPPQIPKDVEQNPELTSMYIVVSDLKNAGSDQTAYPLAAFLKDPSQLDDLVRNGYLKPITSPPKLTQTGNSLNGYVLNDVYQCLTSKAGGAFRQISRAEIEAAANHVVSKRMSVADGSYNPREDQKRIVDAFMRYPQCYSPGASTQMQEATADWLGSQVEGDYLAGKKLTNEKARLATIGLFAEIVCLNRSQIKTGAGAQSNAVIIGSAKAILNRKNDGHPASKERIERIILEEPRIRQALNCPANGSKPCLHSAGVPTVFSHGSSETIQ